MLRERDIIGPYELIQYLGKGSFAEVWLAERKTPIATTRVALKIPFNDLIDFENIKNEAVLWVNASGHANVVSIIEANVYEDRIVIASEFASGGTLQARLDLEEKLPLFEATRLIAGVLEGLRHLHSKRIIHRDIKPANVLLQNGTPRLADFGISRLIRTEYSIETVAGTPAFMAPEAFDGVRNEQTDLWSVGVMLYQMVAGELPFSSDNTSELIGSIVLKAPKPLGIEYPLSFSKIVEKSLAKNCSVRYRTTNEFLKDLQQFERDSYASESARSPSIDNGKMSFATLVRQRNNWFTNRIRLVGAFLLFSIVAISIFAFVQGQKSDRMSNGSPPGVNSTEQNGRSNIEITNEQESPVLSNSSSNRANSLGEGNGNSIPRLGVKKKKEPY